MLFIDLHPNGEASLAPAGNPAPDPLDPAPSIRRFGFLTCTSASQSAGSAEIPATRSMRACACARVKALTLVIRRIRRILLVGGGLPSGSTRPGGGFQADPAD